MIQKNNKSHHPKTHCCSDHTSPFSKAPRWNFCKILEGNPTSTNRSTYEDSFVFDNYLHLRVLRWKQRFDRRMTTARETDSALCHSFSFFFAMTKNTGWVFDPIVSTLYSDDRNSTSWEILRIDLDMMGCVSTNTQVESCTCFETDLAYHTEATAPILRFCLSSYNSKPTRAAILTMV